MFVSTSAHRAGTCYQVLHELLHLSVANSPHVAIAEPVNDWCQRRRVSRESSQIDPRRRKPALDRLGHRYDSSLVGSRSYRLSRQ